MKKMEVARIQVKKPALHRSKGGCETHANLRKGKVGVMGNIISVEQ